MDRPATGNAPPCPLCHHSSSECLDSFPSADLVSEYRRQMKVDPSDHFQEVPLELRQCFQCGLQFFSPLVSGSKTFYEQLSQRQQTYYVKSRWEFEQALQEIGKENFVLDVGCGDGHFLSLVPSPHKAGLEHNPHALKEAAAKGLHVQETLLQDWPSESVDVLTMFQVLEHVIDPFSMLQHSVRILKPAGKLIVAVPDNDGFTGRVLQMPLNAPPHHPLRWREAPFRFLPSLFPLRLARLDREPLADEHLFLYRNTKLIDTFERVLHRPVSRFSKTPWTIFVRKASNALTLLSLKCSRKLPNRSTPGHSILVILQKRGS